VRERAGIVIAAVRGAPEQGLGEVARRSGIDDTDDTHRKAELCQGGG